MTRNYRERPSRIPWPPILLAGVFGGGWLMGRFYPLGWPGMHDLPARLIGAGFVIAGIVLIVWGAFTFRRHATTILPNKGASSLVTDGPFRHFRNPIYLGDVLIMAGLSELTDNVWYVILAVPFVILVTFLAILPEERHLESKFADAYRTYRDRTRRWL